MSPEIVGVLAIVLLFVLLFLRVPIAFVLAFVGFLGYMAISGVEPGFAVTGLIPFAKTALYGFTVIPLFIIMGHFAYHAGIVNQLMQVARLWVGVLPGGLVQATIAGAAAFGAASGSGVASCAVVSRVTIPDMQRQGVNRSLAFGAVASAGTIATMIPPSMLMVIYGIIAEQSIGKMLIAGIIPGIITAAVYMTMVYIRVRRNPALAPPLKGISWRERFSSLKNIWGISVLIVVIMGGIYSGAFTPTEAGGIGAFTAFLMAARRLRLPQLRESLYETMQTTGMIFLIIACAFIFGYLISISRLPAEASEIIGTLPRWAMLAGVIVLYIILGFFLDMIAALFITLPIILPAIDAAGFNLIWFGVIVIHLCEISLVTPPFGLNLFIIKGVIPDSKMSEIIAGIWPFFLADLVTLTILIAFPQVVLFLPNLMSR